MQITPFPWDKIEVFMKKILFLALAVVICASSLAACVDREANQSVNSQPATQSNAQTNTQSQPSSQPVTPPSTPENPEDSVETGKTVINADFFKSGNYISLQHTVFDIYKDENVGDIDTTPNYFIDSLAYDEASKTAIVQLPCIEIGGGPKIMTITLSLVENTWQKQKVEYTDKSNNSNIFPVDDVFYNTHFKPIQNLAFKFLRAYVQADINTAKGMMTSIENEKLDHFRTQADTLKNTSSFAVEVVSYTYNEADKSGTAWISVDHDIDPSAGNEGIDYLVLTVNFKEETDANGNITTKYEVEEFDLDT